MINERGAVESALLLSDEWQMVCNEGRELSQLEDRIQWQLADLCLKVRACGQYGTGRMESFAKEIDRGRSYVYGRALFAEFYSDPDVRDMITNSEFVTFSKCEMIRRFTGDITLAVEWIIATSFNGYTPDELERLLLLTFKQVQPQPSPTYEGIYTGAQLRSIIDPHKQYRGKLWEIDS